MDEKLPPPPLPSTEGPSSHEEASTAGARSPLDMDPEIMRRLGYRAVDALVERASALRDVSPWEGGTRRELEPLLREPAPEEGRDAAAVMERALRDVLPRAGRIDHPRFFAFVPSSPTWPSVLGDFLAAGSTIFQGTWLESAGPSQLELVVLDWFREWLGMPEGTGGLLTSGGSAANLDALVAARHAAGDPTEPVVYMSDQGHSSLERGARVAGVPPEAIRTIPTDERFRLLPDALDRALAEDRRAGRTPVAVCVSAGATNTGAVDPLEELAEVAGAHGTWLHVDAAYGGFAALTERGRRAFRGLERADSVTLDPHKWLFQPYEAGCLLVRDVRRLEDAFRVLPEYLQDTELGLEQVNFANRGVQLTRSFRALKIWLSVQTFGVGAFREAIDRGIDLAEAAGRQIEAAPDLESLAPPSLGVVCFRYRPRGTGLDDAQLDALNASIQERIVEERSAMISSTRLRGRYSLRLCILNFRSRQDDVDAVLDRIRELGRELAAGAG